MRQFAAVATLLLFSGCYAYAPVAEQVPEPGSRIRAHVTDATTVEFVPRFGPGVSTLSGRLIRLEDDEVSLSIDAIDTYRRGELYWNGEALQLARTKIAFLEYKKFSKWRTALFVGSIIAGGLLIDNSFGVFGIIADGKDDGKPIEVN